MGPRARLSLLFALGAATGLLALAIAGRLDTEPPAAPTALGFGSSTPPPGPLEDGWTRTVLGTPSGAAPLDRPTPPSDAAPPDPSSAAAGGAAPPATTPVPAGPDRAAARVVVQPGDTLGAIVLRHYGWLRPALLDAVADHNGLADANALVAGRMLELPAEERLGVRRP